MTRFFELHCFNKLKQTRRLVGLVGILWTLQLNLETLHANLKAVHGLDGLLGRRWVIVADKAYLCGQKRQKGVLSNQLCTAVIEDVFLPKHLL